MPHQISCEKAKGMSFLRKSADPTNSMNVAIQRGWKIIIYNIGKILYVQTPKKNNYLPL